MLALELRHRPLVVGWCHICLYLYQVLCAAWSILVANVAPLDFANSSSADH